MHKSICLTNSNTEFHHTTPEELSTEPLQSLLLNTDYVTTSLQWPQANLPLHFLPYQPIQKLVKGVTVVQPSMTQALVQNNTLTTAGVTRSAPIVITIHVHVHCMSITTHVHVHCMCKYEATNTDKVKIQFVH